MNEAYNHDVLLSLTTVSACHKSGFWRVHHLASVLQCSAGRARPSTFSNAGFLHSFHQICGY